MKQSPINTVLAAIDRDSSNSRTRARALIDAWSVPDHSCWIPLYPENSVESYSGLYLRKAERKILAA